MFKIGDQVDYVLAKGPNRQNGFILDILSPNTFQSATCDCQVFWPDGTLDVLKPGNLVLSRHNAIVSKTTSAFPKGFELILKGCECGAEKCKSPAHAHYCPKFQG
jgi:hypothetical protein